MKHYSIITFKNILASIVYLEHIPVYIYYIYIYNTVVRTPFCLLFLVVRKYVRTHTHSESFLSLPAGIDLLAPAFCL